MVNGALKIEYSKTSNSKRDLRPLPARCRPPQRRNDQTARTNMHCPTPKTTNEKWRLASGFGHSSPTSRKRMGKLDVHRRRRKSALFPSSEDPAADLPRLS
jgi:hypothetical protein